MAPRIPPLPYRKVHRLLHDHGFAIERQSGSHVVYVHPDGRRTVVPRHGRDLSPTMVSKVLEDAGIDPEVLRS